MSELKQLKQLSQLDAAQVGGGEGECTPTATLNGPVGVQSQVADFGAALIGTYEGIIQATSYAIERVINAVSSNP